eukprot:scaffold26695_cov211-Cylindrotheca_fusiformis.AAC.1
MAVPCMHWYSNVSSVLTAGIVAAIDNSPGGADTDGVCGVAGSCRAANARRLGLGLRLLRRDGALASGRGATGAGLHFVVALSVCRLLRRFLLPVGPVTSA